MLCWNMQRSFDWSENLFKKSEALHSHSKLEHTKVIWLIRMFFLRNQRHCTHILSWNIQRSCDWSEHFSREIKGIALTSYVGTWKNHLTDQNIFQRNQRHCTHKLCRNMQRSFDWSEHSSKEIRGTALTCYIGTCNGHLTNQNVLPEKSETMHSHPILEHEKVIWLIRTFFLRNQRHYTHILCWNMQKSFNWSEHAFWKSEGLH